jgi:hypothetical protein
MAALGHSCIAFGANSARGRGLGLTPAQVARVWRMERHLSERIVAGLALAEFLLKNQEGAYLRASGAYNADQ